eukprot:165541_1
MEVHSDCLMEPPPALSHSDIMEKFGITLRIYDTLVINSTFDQSMIQLYNNSATSDMGWFHLIIHECKFVNIKTKDSILRMDYQAVSINISNIIFQNILSGCIIRCSTTDFTTAELMPMATRILTINNISISTSQLMESKYT